MYTAQLVPIGIPIRWRNTKSSVNVRYMLSTRYANHAFNLRMLKVLTCSLSGFCWLTHSDFPFVTDTRRYRARRDESHLNRNNCANKRLIRSFSTSKRMLVYILAKSNVCNGTPPRSPIGIELFMRRTMTGTRRESRNTQDPLHLSPPSRILATHMSSMSGTRASNTLPNQHDNGRKV